MSLNCEVLQTLRLSPDLAEQLRLTMGLPASALVLYPGASTITSSGAIPFLMVADGDLHP